MSTFRERMVKCGCCGSKATVTYIGSTNSFGGCDLDTRPAPMARWTINEWIQACPHCGYVCPSLDRIIDGAVTIVKSRQYIECDGIRVKDELAKNFIRWGLISAKQCDLEEEMRAYLHAAWACDDAEEEETASLLRKRCELLLTELMKTDNRGILRLIDADLLRRSRQFDEVIRRYPTAYQWMDDFDILEGLHFEFDKAKEKDDRRYKFTGKGMFELNESWKLPDNI